MKKLMTIFIVLGMMLGLSQIAIGQGVVVSWLNQTAGDLYSATAYSAFKAGLVSRGHTVRHGILEITAANLDGVDLFFHGIHDHILTASEQTAISVFVANGGCVILEADSATSEQASGNSLLAAFPAGAPSYNGVVSGSNSATGGSFTANDTWTTNGPLGDLRGLNFGVTLAADIEIGDGVLVGTNNDVNIMVEYKPYDASGGRILVVGDALGCNFFQDVSSDYYNENNQKAFLNFFENQLANAILEVGVDIKPGSCPNPFNNKSQGSVPFAIVGTADFDVTTIDSTTIELTTPSGNIIQALDEWELKDSTQPYGDNTDCYTCFDADDPVNFNCDLDPDIPGDDAYCGDGKPDLVVKFDTQALADAIGEVDREVCIELLLTGLTQDGVLIYGSDKIVIKTKIKD